MGSMKRTATILFSIGMIAMGVALLLASGCFPYSGYAPQFLVQAGDPLGLMWGPGIAAMVCMLAFRRSHRRVITLGGSSWVRGVLFYFTPKSGHKDVRGTLDSKINTFPICCPTNDQPLWLCTN